MEIKVRLEGQDPALLIEVLRSRSKDLSRPLREFHAYMVAAIDRQFAAAGAGSGATGSVARGVYWRPFSPQYLRADGTLVPAWGGVPKARGRGLVKGRKRPSGQRVSALSALMQDTGRLRQRAATGYVRLTPRSLEFGPNLEYAPYQNALRPWLFVGQEEADLLARRIAEHLFNG